MTHDPVDRVLQDLDRALAVQPSTALTAQVRRQIEARRESTRPRLRIWASAAIAAATVFVTSNVVLKRVNVDAPAVARSPVAVATPPFAGADMLPARSDTRAAKPVATSPARTTTGQPLDATDAHRRPGVQPGPIFRVIISPGDRLGLEQLQSAVSSGRITSEMLAPVAVSLEPTMVVPTILAVHEAPIQVGAPPTTPDERGVDGIDAARPGGPRLLPSNAPSSFTRSAS